MFSFNCILVFKWDVTKLKITLILGNSNFVLAPPPLNWRLIRVIQYHSDSCRRGWGCFYIALVCASGSLVRLNHVLCLCTLVNSVSCSVKYISKCSLTVRVNHWIYLMFFCFCFCFFFCGEGLLLVNYSSQVYIFLF